MLEVAQQVVRASSRIALACVMFGGACGWVTRASFNPPRALNARHSAGRRQIKVQVRKRDLLTLVGHCLIVGVHGSSLDKATQEAVQKGRVAGILLLAHNVSSQAQLIELSKQVGRAAVKGRQLPPFICIDEEGGKVNRLKDLDGAPELESARQQAALAPVRLQEKACQMALFLRKCGINMNLAPVVDLDIRSRNGVIGSRSYGSEPDDVVEMAGAFIAGMKQGGVLSVIKHYPGHGLTSVDSHHELPVVTDPLNVIEVHERPFRELVKRGADGVMLAHMVCKALDPVYPASLSKKVIDRLREFAPDTLVMTDSGGMGALNEFGDQAQRATLTLKSGGDIYLTTATVEDLGRNFNRKLAKGLKGFSQVMEKAADRADTARRRLYPSLTR